MLSATSRGRQRLKSPRLKAIADALRSAGFAVALSRNMDGWLKAHAVFVTATSAALHLAGGDPGRLARMAEVLRLMVRATREGFASLRSLGSFDAPRNLRLLYGRMPEWFAVVYWQRTLPTPLGELGLAAHARVARQEMSTLAREVQRLVQSAPAGAPTLEDLYRRAGMVESAG